MALQIRQRRGRQDGAQVARRTAGQERLGVVAVLGGLAVWGRLPPRRRRECPGPGRGVLPRAAQRLVRGPLLSIARGPLALLYRRHEAQASGGGSPAAERRAGTA